MRRLTALLFLLALPLLAAETGYRVEHPDGTVEFTDQPPPGAEALPLPEVQTIPAPPPPQRPAPRPADRPTVEESPSYTRIAVTRPEPEETLWVANWEVPVAVALEPALAGDHALVIRLNGEEVARGRSTSFTLHPVYRGTHQVSAAVVDADGNRLITSEPVTFYVHKHSIRR